MKNYSIIYSKKGESWIVENNIILDNEEIVGLLNDKEKKVNDLGIEKEVKEKRIKELNIENNDKEKKIKKLTEENNRLSWYFEELRVHVAPERLEQIDSLYEQLKK